MNTTQTIRLGTRGSELALWQAHYVQERLSQLGYGSEVIEIATQGDLDRNTPLGVGMGSGVFVKEIEQALLDDRIDVAVHSAKDLPTQMADGLVLGAVPARALTHDVMIFRQPGMSFKKLPGGARIATGSPRRRSQLLAQRSDLDIVALRGNLPTRLKKIREEGSADATLLAIAGLRRLGLFDDAMESLSFETMVPAMNQGALALQTRRGELTNVMAKLNHGTYGLAVEAERIFISQLGADCHSPTGVYAHPNNDGSWRLYAMIGCADGSHVRRMALDRVRPHSLISTARRLPEKLLANAPAELREVFGR